MFGEYISETLYHQINFSFISVISILLILSHFTRNEGKMAWIIKSYYISVKILQLSIILFILRFPHFESFLDFIEAIFPLGVIFYNYKYTSALYEDEIEEM